MKSRAAIQVEPRGPVVIEEIDIPDPGPNQVTVRNFASGVCYSQVHQLRNPGLPRPMALGHEGTGVVTHVGKEVTHVLRERRAEVLVGGTHGVGGLKRTLLGSVSQQLLEHAPCSVLLVRDRPPLDGPRTVVAGVDGSGATPAVLAMAGRAAVILSAKLVIAHAADELIPSFASTDQEHALRAWAREQGQRILDEARASVTAPLEEVAEDLREGRAMHELVALCEERRPVLVVVGSRGLHGFKGLLLGSTARHLVNNAPCPALIVKTATNEDAH
jgi:nucleotide-binding universal stress UspA family protein